MEETTNEQAAAVAEQGGGLGGLLVSIWEHGVFGVGFGKIFVAALLLGVFIVLRHFFARWLQWALETLTRRTSIAFDDEIADALHPPLAFAPVVLGVFVAGRHLELSGDGEWLFDSLLRSLVVFTLFWAFGRLIAPVAASMSWLERHMPRELTNWMWTGARWLIWLIGGATIMEIWGMNVASIIAGFGLLGVAVALGAQDLFKNLISGVLILSERRLRVGDWIKVPGVVEGTVEAIGFRSTKVRQFDKAPVYVANQEFADGAVVNFGEMTNRRISWSIGLEYRTTSEQLQRIRDRVEEAILEDDRYLAPPEASVFVRLDSFAASSIDLLIYCFTKTRDWGEWLVIKEELLIMIKRIVEEEGAGFAFPSQSLYIESAPAEMNGDSGAPADAPDREPLGRKASRDDIREAAAYVSAVAAPTQDAPSNDQAAGGASVNEQASDDKSARDQARARPSAKSEPKSGFPNGSKMARRSDGASMGAQKPAPAE